MGIKHIIKKFLSQIGINTLNRKQFEAYTNSNLPQIISRWTQEDVSPGLLKYVFSHYQRSYSQLQQDLVAEYILGLGNTKTGFFVEFGATDGVTLSNSFVLEKNGWIGILAEPDSNWHSELENNRNSVIDKRCVFSDSGEKLSFINSKIGELSGIQEFASQDGWSTQRLEGEWTTVETISLQDLLKTHNAPRKIDYLSIDTEGSEYKIIEKFIFSDWDISFISIEHNYTNNEILIDHKLREFGFARIYPAISAWDAWYIKKDIYKKYFSE